MNHLKWLTLLVLVVAGCKLEQAPSPDSLAPGRMGGSNGFVVTQGAGGTSPWEVSIQGAFSDGGAPVIIVPSQQPCTPVTFYSALTGVLKDAGGTFFGATCSNVNGLTPQFVQVQGQTTAPLPDAGPAPIEITVFPGGATAQDPLSLVGANMPNGMAFDVSSVHGFYTPDGGSTVVCTFCVQ